MTYRLARRSALVGLASLALATTVSAGLFTPDPPADLDLSLEKTSAAGLYAVGISPVSAPVKVGPMHAWTVRLTDAAGRPVEGATITIDGGMPQHGHGLPTAPAVTRQLGDGRYVVDGVKFNMSGWWELKLGIEATEGSDTVTFNLVL